MLTGAAPNAGAPAGPGYLSSGTASSFTYSAPRRLRRVIADKKIAGVCAGFAEYFDMDVTLVRLLWLGIGLMTGVVPLLMVYMVAWIVLPKG